MDKLININKRIKEIELKRGAISNEEIQELIYLKAELRFRTIFSFK